MVSGMTMNVTGLAMNTLEALDIMTGIIEFRDSTSL